MCSHHVEDILITHTFEEIFEDKFVKISNSKGMVISLFEGLTFVQTGKSCKRCKQHLRTFFSGNHAMSISSQILLAEELRIEV